MQYFSPLSFLPDGAGAALAPRDMKLAKHKLMAEFELAGTTTIPVNGREMSRNDVLQLFDQLDESGHLGYHAQVAADPVLLHFLEHHEIVGEAVRFTTSKDQQTEAFIAWLSPYFAFAFRRATVRMFRDVKPKEFETLIVNDRLMTDEAEWNAWQGVEDYMQHVQEKFEQVAAAKYHSPRQAATYAGYEFVWLLCNLPEERFSTIINNYAFALMQLAIKEFNNKKRDYSFEIMGYARSLKVSESVMASLQAKEQEMSNIVHKNDKATSRNNLWWYVRIGLFVAYVISRLATCNG